MEPAPYQSDIQVKVDEAKALLAEGGLDPKMRRAFERFVFENDGRDSWARVAACWRSSSLPHADTWRRAIADEQSHRRSSRRTLA